MRGREIGNFVVIATLLGWLAGCAQTSAPRRWLPSASAAQTDTYGAWIDVQLRPQPASLRGELIAIGADSLFVLGEQFYAIAVGDILSARVVSFHAPAAPGVAMVLGGLLMTLSNGAFLVFTAPLWLIAGSSSNSKYTYTAIRDYPKVKVSDLRMFARFPQGMPDALQREWLTGKKIPPLP